MKTSFKLETTKDYSVFKRSKNRSINPKDVEKKRKSIQEIGLQSPIIVNKKYQIVDGQHRFEALVQLNKPVDFLISYNWKQDEDTATINNTQKSWSVMDWAEFRASQGNKKVQEALVLARNYRALTDNKMNLVTAMELLNAKTNFNLGRELRNNTFDYDHENAQDLFQILQILAQYPSGVRNPYCSKLARAFKSIKNKLGYINKKAIHRMAQRNFIISYASEKDMINYLTKIYNQALKK